MIRFCIVFITILGFSGSIKLRLSESGNWTTFRDISGVTITTYGSCGSFNELFIECGEDIYVDPNSAESVCKGIWKACCCVEKKAKGCSNEDDILTGLKNNQNNWEGNLCQNYKRSGYSCGLQWWVITLIVLGGILIVGGCGFYAYKKCRNSANKNI